MDQKPTKKTQYDYRPQDIQRMIACFEDEILPSLPSKEEILQRAKQRRLKRQIVNKGSLLAFAAMMLGIYGYNPVYQQQHYVTQLGEQQDIVLSDGSQIKLNTQTQIQVQQRLRSREITLLQGEAIFEVAHGQNPLSRLFERDFTVTTGEVYIRDIGTIFNVHKDADDEVTVTVLQGEVEVSRLQQKRLTVPLQEGQQIHYQQQAFSIVKTVDPYTATAWQSGKLVFEQTTLQDVIQDFQRYSDFKVTIADEQLKQLPINGQFQAKNYQQFMQILPVVAPVRVVARGENDWKIVRK